VVTAARYFARHAVLLVFLFLALTPASVLAFNPPDPNSPGKHTGEYLHNPHMQNSQTPAPGGGSTGVQNAFGAYKSGSASDTSTELPAFEFQPTGGALPPLTAGTNLGNDAWLVVIILAALIAANLVLGVLYLSRGGNFVYRRVLRPAPATA
jgi:hypothetical protein